MENSQFRKPLFQSAAILGAVFVLFALISSPVAGTSGGVSAVFSGIGNLILFLIGLGIALPLSIAILIGIFLGAVALQNRETATQMYSDLKKNFSTNIGVFKNRWSCCTNSSEMNISEEEYNQMNLELEQLKEDNGVFQEDLRKIKIENSNLNDTLAKLTKQNSTLTEQFSVLDQSVEELHNSGKAVKEMLDTLTTQFDEGQKFNVEEKVTQLEEKQKQSIAIIDDFSARLDSFETNIRQSPTAGIFSYIKNDDDQTFFVTAVEEAVSQEMTYAQIDEYLTKNLSPELDTIIKDHPSLTKTYIRNLKRD